MIKNGFKEILEAEGNEKDFSYNGFDCRIRRVAPETRGHLCGYIVIPEGHKLFGKDYDAVEEIYEYEIPSHGGLTFSGMVEGEHWIGFDCAHLYDLSPCYHPEVEDGEVYGNGVYRDMPYVESAIKKMIDFIINH